MAAANLMVIARPQGHSSVAMCLMLFGGPILFLAAQGWYLGTVSHISPRLQLAGIAALVLMGCSELIAPRYVALVLAGRVLRSWS